MQQVRELVGARVKDPPQGKQEQYGGRCRHDQMPPQTELLAELGPERADDCDVHRQVDQYDGEADAANARQRAIGGHPAVVVRELCQLKAPGNPYADPKAGDEKLAVVDLAAGEPLARPVALAAV